MITAKIMELLRITQRLLFVIVCYLFLFFAKAAAVTPSAASASAPAAVAAVLGFDVVVAVLLAGFSSGEC